MNEKLLQFLWNYKVFTLFNFKDTEGNAVEILDFGQWNHNSGPDFTLAKIKTKNIVLIGNIELHVKSSDWIFHHHSTDKAFENVILHVVYQHDIEIEELKIRNIPTLELKNYLDADIVARYESLYQENVFIPCEKIFDVSKIPVQFAEETLLKKLHEKSTAIEQQLHLHQNNFEAVLFHNLAYAFGLKVNAEIFRELVQNIDFSVIQKIRKNEFQLEALFFGTAGWLEKAEDEQSQIWKREYDFLQKKYQLSDLKFRPKFLRLRPPNFPTLRLSQLANFYSREPNLFSKIMGAKSFGDLYHIFEPVKASSYWNSHFNFYKETVAVQEKVLTQDFIERVIINAVLPLKYTYLKHTHEAAVDDILNDYEKLSAEENSIIQNWKKLGVSFENALQSQAFLYHYKNFCQKKNCLNCAIGYQILKS